MAWAFTAISPARCDRVLSAAQRFPITAFLVPAWQERPVPSTVAVPRDCPWEYIIRVLWAKNAAEYDSQQASQEAKALVLTHVAYDSDAPRSTF